MQNLEAAFLELCAKQTRENNTKEEKEIISATIFPTQEQEATLQWKQGMSNSQGAPASAASFIS